MRKARHVVRFGVLGPLDVRVGDRGVAVPRPTMRLLLGVLLLTPGEYVAEERLASLVWGPDGMSRRALHTSVSRLRSWLRTDMSIPDAVDHAGGAYRLCIPADVTDVARFRALADLAAQDTDPAARLEHLSAALREWRGMVLADMYEWVHTDPVVTALDKTRVECACRLADVAVRLGRSQAALPHLEQLSAALPYDEVVHARLIRVLGAHGRRAEALRRYECFRARLSEELGVDPSNELREAYLALLQDDGERPGPPAGAHPRGTPSDSTPDLMASNRDSLPWTVPAELPPDVAAFAGRRDELGRVCGLLRQAGEGPPVTVAVDGAAGVGKSALAVHAAHTCVHEFPDGQLYADLGGSAAAPAPTGRPQDAGPVPAAHPGEVLGRFLRSLGVPAHEVPVSVAERATRFRSLVAGRRLLVVLDNVASAAQVRPLLPASPTCAVLVTSRQVLSALDGATHVHLHRLPESEATALLSRLVGRHRTAAEPAAVARIARSCGYLPLALRIAAAKLATRPDWPMHVLAGRLDDARRRLDELRVADLSVRASIAASYQALRADETAGPVRRMFCLLGLLDQAEVATPVAAALADEAALAVEPTLERLADARLLHACAPGRWRMDDLVRLFAREQAERCWPAAWCAAALRRAFHCYLATARRASMLLGSAGARRAECGEPCGPDRLQHPGIELADIGEAAAWARCERANLLAAARRAAAQSAEDAEAGTVAVALAAALYQPFALMGCWADLADLNRLALRTAARLGDRAGEARARADLAVARARMAGPGQRPGTAERHPAAYAWWLGS